MTAATLRPAVFAPASRERTTAALAAVALLALLVLPWAASGGPSALMHALAGNVSMWPLLLATAATIAFAALGRDTAVAVAAAFALLWAFGSGFSAGAAGLPFGIGAAVALGALTVCFSRALARRGLFGGDVTVATVVVVSAALLALFIFFPVGKSLVAALQDDKGAFAPGLAAQRLFSGEIWSLGCLAGGARCGVAINSLVLASLVGLLSTLLGLAFALTVQRGGQRHAALFKTLSVLPIITPPFVIALALIVLFGRTGLVTGWLGSAFGIPRSRWIYGLAGVTLAQLLSFTPIAFMILQGALAAVSPALEEAAQTLRASRWRVFRSVTWPLLRPALANAFLLGFVESLADFANPIVLAGNFEVLSIKIFFAIAGAQNDPGRAAVLAAVLLIFTLAAFALQQRWLGKASYTTVSGKGDGGLAAKLPPALARTCFGVSVLWVLFTLACYAVIIAGGFVKDIGRGEMTPSLTHFAAGFGIEWGERGLAFTGSAWNSLFTTITVAGISAPLTAVIGLLGAYVITRHRFAGRHAFEFLTLVSDSGHGDRRFVHRRLQRRAAGADRRHADPGAVFRVPQHAGRRARRRGGTGADRQDAR
jgi:iron(III) transport system permease protein